MRPRKVALDSVVSVEPTDTERFYYGTVVAYRDDAEPRYLVVETDSLGRHPGRATWRDADELVPLGRKSRKPGRVYRKTLLMYGLPEDRECGCYCCPHMNGTYEPAED